jgi:hypothetical protein
LGFALRLCSGWGGEPVEPFEICYLVFGIFIKFKTLLYSFNDTPERLASDDAALSSGMKLLMQFFEVFAGDVGIYLRRRYIHMPEHNLHGS